MSVLALRVGLSLLGFASGLSALDVPSLQIRDKLYDAPTGTVEFTLVNDYDQPAVSWSIQVLSVRSDGGKGKFSILEDRQDYLDPDRWVSETRPERGYVPAGGKLRQSLKVPTDIDGFVAVKLEVRAVVYEDVESVGDAAVIERIFAGRVAQLLATREALAELFEARITGAGIDSVLANLLERRLESRSTSEESPTQAVESSRGTYLELRYRNLYQASLAPDPDLWIANLEEEWSERVRLLARAIRPSDRERWNIGFEGEVVGERKP